MLRQGESRGQKIVVILNVCGPVDMREYIDDVDAVFCIFYPGQEGGRAMAEALLGEINPSGKLPLTFRRGMRMYPAARISRAEYGVWYAEGILSATAGTITAILNRCSRSDSASVIQHSNPDAKLSKNVLRYDKDAISLAVTVKNTSKRRQRSHQVYIGQENPPCQAAEGTEGLHEVELMPGETKTVTFTLDGNLLRSYDEEIGGWIVEPGTYSVYVGNSSRNITQVLPFRVEEEILSGSERILLSAMFNRARR